MKSQLFAAVLLGALVSSVVCSSDLQTRSSFCNYNPEGDCTGKPENQRVPIPCEDWCNSYYVCKTNGKYVRETCTLGWLRKFDSKTLECNFRWNVDCKWYQQPPPEPSTTPDPQPTNTPSGKPTAPPPPASTTVKSNGASATSPTAVLLAFLALAVVPYWV